MVCGAGATGIAGTEVKVNEYYWHFWQQIIDHRFVAYHRKDKYVQIARKTATMMKESVSIL